MEKYYIQKDVKKGGNFKYSQIIILDEDLKEVRQVKYTNELVGLKRLISKNESKQHLMLFDTQEFDGEYLEVVNNYTVEAVNAFS